jgi:hypothetical protein
MTGIPSISLKLGLSFNNSFADSFCQYQAHCPNPQADEFKSLQILIIAEFMRFRPYPMGASLILCQSLLLRQLKASAAIQPADLG